MDANPPELRTWSTTLADIQGKRPTTTSAPALPRTSCRWCKRSWRKGNLAATRITSRRSPSTSASPASRSGSDQFVTTGADITEREPTERALQDNAALYRAIVDSRHVVKLLVEPDTGRIVDANRAAADFYGYSQEELRHLRAWDLSTRSREELLPLLSAIATGQIAAPLPHSRHRLRNGELRDVTVYADLLQREEGVLLLATVIDVTETKRAEEALRARERHYRLLIQSLHFGVVVHAPDTEILLANEQASRMLGLSVDEMTGKTAADPAWVFVREDETPMPFDEYPVNRVLAERQPVRNLILGIRHPHTGERVWVLVNAAPEFDGAGHLLQIVVTFTDVTERKRAEIALQESEARLQRVLDGTNDGFWEWNAVTGETLSSGRWAEMLGYDPAEIEPHVRSWERLVHPADLPHTWAAVQAHFSGAAPQYQNEHRLRAKNGEWRWILDRGKVSARDAEGRPLRMSGTHTDVTEAKIAERALRAALEEKTVLMKEIHHRVKNNLQIVGSLLNLQIDRIGAPEAPSALRDTQNRIRSMALLHETLYRSDSPARIGLPDYSSPRWFVDRGYSSCRSG